jgi:hypothetical protein
MWAGRGFIFGGETLTPGAGIANRWSEQLQERKRERVVLSMAAVAKADKSERRELSERSWTGV